MAAYNKENVNDIFRKISSLNEILKKDEEGKKDLVVKEAIGMTPLNVKFKKLNERAIIPTYAHDGDVGMDLTAIDVEYNADMDCYIYHTGLAFETNKHYGMFLFPRSSNRKTDAYLCNHVGIADSAIYRGEIMLCFKNRTSLRQHALETRLIEFWNAIDSGKGLKEAEKESYRKWLETFKDPMLFAPYKVGDRVGQMVVLPYPNVELSESEELSDTDRGSGGFGSTSN